MDTFCILYIFVVRVDLCGMVLLLFCARLLCHIGFVLESFHFLWSEIVLVLVV